MITSWTGKCSSFGGPRDTGIGISEGLGLIESSDLNEWFFRRIFLRNINTDVGLGRNLDPDAFYCAMRFAYGSFSGVSGEILTGMTRDEVRRGLFVISFNDKACFSQAADWGPNLDTNRLIDCSPGVLSYIGAQTDSVVDVTFIQA